MMKPAPVHAAPGAPQAETKSRSRGSTPLKSASASTPVSKTEHTPPKRDFSREYSTDRA